MLILDTASDAFGESLKLTIKNFCVNYGFKIIGALIVFIVGIWLAKKAVKAMGKLKLFSKIDKDAVGITQGIIKAVLYLIVVVAVIGILGVPLASVVTVLASLGVAIGLAVQGSLSNLAGGLMLLIFKPFRVGDYIKTKEHEGTVDEIGIFSTALVTIDNRRVVLPNAGLSNSDIVNNTYYPERMVDLTFSVDCDAPIDLVVDTLREMAMSQPKRLASKDIVCRFASFGDSCAKYQLRVWCDTKDYLELYYALLDGGKRALTEKGIKIPYPIMEVIPPDERDYGH